ncbi:MAG: DUF1573 domain-containing protein [Bacteroidales bacterium]
MKNTIILVVFGLLFSTQITAQSDTNKEEKPVIKFEETVYNYGEIEVNSDGTCEFEFENTGEEPLLLTKVRAACGCTSPKWPKKPVKPGETETIKVKYNTRIKGSFTKSVMVYSNAEDSPVKLTIKGKVLDKKENDNN